MGEREREVREGGVKDRRDGERRGGEKEETG